MDDTTHITTYPDYGHAPVPAAEAQLHDFGDPKAHAGDQPDEHRAYTDHDFGVPESHG
jgi:hypothetical protein